MRSPGPFDCGSLGRWPPPVKSKAPSGRKPPPSPKSAIIETAAAWFDRPRISPAQPTTRKATLDTPLPRTRLIEARCIGRSPDGEQFVTRFAGPFRGIQHGEGVPGVAAVAVKVGIFADAAVVVARVGEIAPGRTIGGRHARPLSHLDVHIQPDEDRRAEGVAGKPAGKAVLPDHGQPHALLPRF